MGLWRRWREWRQQRAYHAALAAAPDDATRDALETKQFMITVEIQARRRVRVQRRLHQKARRLGVVVPPFGLGGDEWVKVTPDAPYILTARAEATLRQQIRAAQQAEANLWLTRLKAFGPLAALTALLGSAVAALRWLLAWWGR